MFGWTGSKMALHYVALADRVRLAAGGAAKNKKPVAVVEAIEDFSIERAVALRSMFHRRTGLEQILPHLVARWGNQSGKLKGFKDVFLSGARKGIQFNL